MNFIKDITCNKINNFKYKKSQFNCYDKDGFDLTDLEKKIYKQNGFKLHKILNRKLLAIPWIKFNKNPKIYVDHSILFMRCDIQDECRQFIENLSVQDKRLIYLINTKKKWGVDIDLNWIENDKIYEIIHLEYDSYYFEEAVEIKEKIERFFDSVDVEDMAKQIISKKSEWESINGLKQNDWKAKYFGFNTSEDTRKSYI